MKVLIEGENDMAYEKPAKSPLDLIPTKKPRDDFYNQTMNDYHAKRAALLKANRYLGPKWNKLSKEIQAFREGYEPAKIYSPREYLLDNDIDEFQIDQVRDDIGFDELWDAMQNGQDFYEYASEGGHGFDSAVREKIFKGMSERLGLDYDDIYNQWLYGKRKRPTTKGNPTYNVDNGNPNPKKYVSKFATKYPDRYSKVKQGLLKDLSDEEIDQIVTDLGVTLD